MTVKHILVLGSGSVGKRHLRNFHQMGCQVSAMDISPERVKEASEEISLVHRYYSWQEVRDAISQYDGVVIASPPKFHCEQAIACIESNISVLLEKPAGMGLKDVEQLQSLLSKKLSQKKQKSSKIARLLLGYTYRWWPPLNEFKKQLGKVGKPLHAKFVMSAHLADWHPWEAYQDFFMSSSELGGGALMDESHFLDLLLYFFGMPDSLYANIGKISALEIDTDDNVDILIRYKTGLVATIHLDLFGRPHEKYISVTGEDGTIQWSFEPNQIKFSSVMNHDWDITSFNYERNEMFVELAKDFLQMIDSDDYQHDLLDDVSSTMCLVDACRESNRLKKEVFIQ